MAEEGISPANGHKPDWRGAPARPPAPGAPAAAPRRPGRRRRIIFFLFAAMLVVAAVLFGLVRLLQPFEAPHVLCLPVSEYNSLALPVNSLAQQDGDALRAGFSLGPNSGTFTSQEGHGFLKELEDFCKVPGPRRRVLFLRAHAVSKDGEVYVLPGDAVWDSRGDRWLSLSKDILRPLKDIRDAEVLVILDLTQPLADPRRGILEDRVAGDLDRVLREQPAEGPLYFYACAPGQVSLVSDEMGQSVFGYYLAEGLRGAADVPPWGRKNSRVRVQELIAYVRDRVPVWAAENRAARQTPQAAGNTSLDFDLVKVGPNSSAKAEEAPKPEAGAKAEEAPKPEAGAKAEEAPKPEAVAKAEEAPESEVAVLLLWLKESWKLRDQWWDDGSHRYAPLAFRRLEEELLRAEQRLRGGMGTERVEKELKDAREPLEKAVARARPGGQPEARSLAVARLLGQKEDPALVAELRNQLSQVPRLVKPEDKVQVSKEAKELAAKNKGKPFELAWAAVELAIESATLERVRFLDELLHEKQKPRYVETLLLHRLAGLKADAWPADAAARALWAARECEAALAATPRQPAWRYGARLAVAEAARCGGEKLLFGGDASAWPEASKLLENARRAFDDLRKDGETIGEAERTLDEALTLLPGFLPYLLACRDVDPRDQRHWNAAVEAASRLAEALDKPAPETVATVERTARDLRDALHGLARPFRPYVAGPKKDLAAELEGQLKDAGASKYLELEALLASPRLSAAGRSAVWAAARKLARRLHEKTAAGKAPAAGNAGGVEEEHAALARPRARASLAIDLLTLAGSAKARELQDAQRRATDRPAGAALGEKIRQAWKTDLPAQLRLEKDLARADRLSRMLLPLESSAGDADLAARLRRQEAAARWGALADHFKAEGDTWSDLNDIRDFFHSAAEEYRRHAG